MSYLIFRNGAFWFQIRVPKNLQHRYGRLVRLNLQTNDRKVAKPLALQLGSQWLQRFTMERDLGGPSHPPFAAELYRQLLDSEPESPIAKTAEASVASAPMLPSATSAEAGFEDSVDGLVGYWRQTNPHCTASTYAEVRGIAREFKKVVGKRPAALQRTDITTYRDYLIGKGRQRATVAKKVGFVSTLLQAAFDAGFLEQNVARGLRIPKAKVAPIGRRSFTDKELKRVFESPVYSRGKRYSAGGGEAAAWVPTLALATGARLEELCQLRVDDIYRDPRHGPLIRISDEGEGQRVKTTSSRRIVPVHPDLIAAGFLAYRDDLADDRQEWLFPDLVPDHDGRRGGNFGKWWSRYQRSATGCNLKDRQLVFHCFRHTFKSLARAANIAEEVHDALTGHAGASVGRDYGEVPIGRLVQGMKKIRFPMTLPRIHE